MSPLNLPACFSARPIVLKVEQRFGPSGFSRLIKLLELFAASPFRDAGLIELPNSDWQEALRVGPHDLNALLSYLHAAGWLVFEQASDVGSPLRVTLTSFSEFLPGCELPRVANEWRLWLSAELHMTELQGKDPYNQSLFRHWCATNVTIEEMNAAIELAIKAGAALTPASLHNFLKTVRKEKLDLARR